MWPGRMMRNSPKATTAVMDTSMASMERLRAERNSGERKVKNSPRARRAAGRARARNEAAARAGVGEVGDIVSSS